MNQNQNIQYPYKYFMIHAYIPLLGDGPSSLRVTEIHTCDPHKMQPLLSATLYRPRQPVALDLKLHKTFESEYIIILKDTLLHH